MVDLTPRVRIGELRTRFGTLDGPTPQTAQRFDEVIHRFESFAESSATKVTQLSKCCCRLARC